MSWFKENYRLLTFFVVVLASIGIYSWFCKNNHESFKGRNEKIIEQYNAQLARTNTSLGEITKYIPLKKPTKIDSLYADLQVQYQQSLKNQKLFDESVRAMLELEFAKIQNEYETQEIWVGLITIVFLIFSFYSIMKSEQFERQCHEDAEKIQAMTEKYQTLLANIETDKKRKLEEIDKSYNTWKSATDYKVKNQTTSLVSKELEIFRKERVDKLEEITDRWNSEAQKRLEEVMVSANARVDTITANYAKQADMLLNSTEHKLNGEIRRILEMSETQLRATDINKKIEAFMEAHTAADDDINKLFDGSFNTGGTMTDASTNTSSTEQTQNKDIEDGK